MVVLTFIAALEPNTAEAQQGTTAQSTLDIMDVFGYDAVRSTPEEANGPASLPIDGMTKHRTRSGQRPVETSEVDLFQYSGQTAVRCLMCVLWEDDARSLLAHSGCRVQLTFS